MKRVKRGWRVVGEVEEFKRLEKSFKALEKVFSKSERYIEAEICRLLSEVCRELYKYSRYTELQAGGGVGENSI